MKVQELLEAQLDLADVTITEKTTGEFLVSTKAKAGPTLNVLFQVYKAIGEKKGVTVQMKSGHILEPGYKAMSKILDNRPNGLVFSGVERAALQAAVDSGIEKVKRELKAKEKHKAGAPDRKREAAKFNAEERKRTMAEYDQKYGKGTWKRVTYRQEGGDDGYSYVVRVDGRSKWNGLSQREAMHYKEQEVNDIAKREKLGKYASVKEEMMGAGQARRKLGERVPYDSFKAWFADLPNGASTVVDEATAVTTAHGRSKDFEGVCGKFDSKKNEGWIYEHYLNKSNLTEGRRQSKKADTLFPDFWSWLLNNEIADEDELYEVLDTSYNADTYETSLVSAVKEEIGKKHIKDEHQRAFKHIKFLANHCITGSNNQIIAKIKNAIPTYAEEALAHLTSRWDVIAEAKKGRGDQAEHERHIREETEADTAERHKREGAQFRRDVKLGKYQKLSDEELKKYSPVFQKAHLAG